MRLQKSTALAGALLVFSLALPASAQDATRDWAPLARSLAPGARVELDLTDGTHVEGTVLAHEGDVFVFNPKTRIPVTPWRIGYAEIRSLDVKQSGNGMRPGTKVLIGVGVAVGVLLLMAGIAAAMSY
jgi:hypothetical protein